MLDSNVSTYIDKDGNVQEVGVGGLSFPISYTGTATDAKIDLITDYEGSREKYTTITPGVISLGNGMSSSKLEIASLDNGESTYIRFNPSGILSAKLFAETDDTGSKAVLKVDGNPILASSNVDPEYINTSEILINGFSLTSTSTLEDLCTQILANKTKVCVVTTADSTTYSRLKTLIGGDVYPNGPPENRHYEYQFKVISTDIIYCMYNANGDYCHYCQIVRNSTNDVVSSWARTIWQSSAGPSLYQHRIDFTNFFNKAGMGIILFLYTTTSPPITTVSGLDVIVSSGSFRGGFAVGNIQNGVPSGVCVYNGHVAVYNNYLKNHSGNDDSVYADSPYATTDYLYPITSTYVDDGFTDVVTEL